nr:hypothetical protein [Candidatus Ichthyocystis hellenicum]
MLANTGYIAADTIGDTTIPICWYLPANIMNIIAVNVFLIDSTSNISRAWALSGRDKKRTDILFAMAVVTV